MARIVIMAGGTGGHVFPALAVAKVLQARGWEVHWMGSAESFESRIVPKQGIPLHVIAARRLRGQGWKNKVLAPLRLARAVWQAGRIMRVLEPQVVLGMGGFAAGPGGLAAALLRRPLVIHEQNRIPGLTNRWLAKWARRVLQAFPDSFPSKVGAETTGNPIRVNLLQLPEPRIRMQDRNGPVRLLIIGGSLGAQALNMEVPNALKGLELPCQVRHQAGRGKAQDTREAYRQVGVVAEVSEFIDDMAQAYAWADLVICRAGALTISELAAVGVAAILVPYPHAVDDHQTQNARYLVAQGAACLLAQYELAERLPTLLRTLLTDRSELLRMAEAARRLARPDATERVAAICMQEARP